LVGTRGCEVFEIDSNDIPKGLISGHYNGEVWGCDVNPKDQTFATCGGDKTIRLWSANKMLKASDPFEIDLKSMDWTPDGNHLICGGENGFVLSVNATTLVLNNQI